MNCQQFREIVDSYMSDELLVETNHEVLHHLENCPACRQELALRRNLRDQLRSSVKNSSDARIDPAFAANLRAQLRETALRPKWRQIFRENNTFLHPKMLFAAIACLFMIVVLTGIWVKYRNTQTIGPIAENQTNRSIEPGNSIVNSAPSKSPIIQAVQIAWREISELAVGDHQNCALKFRLQEKPISLEEAAQKYGKVNQDLDKVVIKPLREIFPENTSGEIKLLEAHSCVFEGRRFAHIVLRRQDHVISVLVTKTDLSDPIDEQTITHEGNNFQVAGFRTRHYAVFVVSDLTDSENLTVAQTISKDVRQHIQKFEI